MAVTRLLHARYAPVTGGTHLAGAEECQRVVERLELHVRRTLQDRTGAHPALDAVLTGVAQQHRAAREQVGQRLFINLDVLRTASGADTAGEVP